jgi:hypothetical protein
MDIKTLAVAVLLITTMLLSAKEVQKSKLILQITVDQLYGNLADKFMKQMEIK